MSAALSAGTISINLVTKTAKFTKGMLGAGGSIDKLGKKALAGGARMVKYGAMMGGVAAGGLALLTAAHLKGIDAAAKFADRTNIQIESLQGLHHAAKLYGTSQATVDKGMVRMLKTIADGEKGLSTATDAFDKLGLKAEDLSGLETDEALATIAERMEGLENQSDRTGVAMDIFGRSGEQMGNLLASGGEGIRAATKDAKDLGLIYSRIDAAKVEQANDAMTRVKAVVTGVGQQFTIGIAPYLTALSDMFVDGAKSGDGYKSVIDNVIETGLDGVAFMVDGWYQLELGWQGLIVLGAKLEAAFFDIGNTGYTEFTRLQAEGANLLDYLEGRFDQFGAGVNGIWLNIQMGLAVLTKEATRIIGDTMVAASRALLDVPGFGEVAVKMQEGAFAIRSTGRDMVSSVKKDLEENTANYHAAGQQASDAMNAMGTATGKVHQGLAAAAMDSADRLAAEEKKYFGIKDAQMEAEHKFATAREKIRENSDKDADASLERSKARANLELGLNQEITDAQKKAADSRRTTMSAVSNSLGDLMSISEEFKDSNKTAYNAYKLLAVSQAGINAWLGYSQVLADPNIQPTWLKQGMASVSLTAGLTAASRIAGQRANGGGVAAGSAYRVNERGPELLSVKGRDYLMMGSNSGHVTSNAHLNSRSGSAPQIHVHNYSGQPTETKTSEDGQRIDIIVGRVKSDIAAEIGNGTGDMATAIERSYGLSRRGAR